MWSDEERFGLFSEKEIALSELIIEPEHPRSHNDRRKAMRDDFEIPPLLHISDEHEPEVRSDHSRHIATALAVVAALSLLFFGIVYAALREPPPGLTRGIQ